MDRTPRQRNTLYGDASQLAASAIGIVTCFVFVFTAFYAFFKIQNAISKIRVPAEVELAGLDIPEMGALAYPEFQLSPGTSGGIVGDMVVSPATGSALLEPNASAANG